MRTLSVNLSTFYRFGTKLSKQKSGGCKFKTIFLNLVNKYLTPPPTSTNVERLFSYAGLIADPRRARHQPERLEKILFLRENLAILAFKLEWE